MPAASLAFAEKGPGVLVVVGFGENADAAVADVEAGGDVFFPDDGQEERAGAVHDRYVGERPIFVVGLKGFDDAEEEGVFGDAAHGVIGDAGWDCAVHPGRVGEERVETAVAALVLELVFVWADRDLGKGWVAYVVEIDVDAAEVGEDKVADCVCSLYVVVVGVEGVDEPGIFSGYEIS